MARINFTESVGGDSNRKPFYVSDASLEFDPATGKFVASYQLEEIPGVRYNLAAGRWEWQGADGNWTAGGGGGAVGGVVTARYIYQVERLVGADLGVIYIVYCQSTSTDSAAAPGTLTLAWSNNKNSDVGSELYYVTWFSAAEYAVNPTITISATNEVPDTDSWTLDISELPTYAVKAGDTITSIAVSFQTTVAVLVELNKVVYPTIEDGAHNVEVGWTLDLPAYLVTELFHACSGAAEASGDGGATWNEWVPEGEATVETTPRYPPLGKGIWGCSNGQLVTSSDYLATTPTLVHTFGAAVTAIWVYYSNQREWWVGLADGELWRSLNANLGIGSTWTRIAWFNNPQLPITDIHRGWDAVLRVCYGGAECLAGPPYASPIPTKTSFGHRALRMAIGDAVVRGSEYAPDHWICGSDDPSSQNVVLRTEGSGIRGDLTGEMPGLPNDIAAIGGLAQDYGTPRLNFIAHDGRTWTSEYDVAAKARLAAVQRTSIPGSSGVNHAIFDPDVHGKVYACDEDTGLWLSPDGMVSWIRVRALGSGRHSRQVSTGAPAWVVS